MGMLIGRIVMLSASILIGFILLESILRTKSALRWVKGYKFNRHMEQDEIINLLETVQYPEKMEVSVNEDGEVLFITQCHQYPVKIYDEGGCTIIGFLVNWVEVSKSKRKKVAFDWDNLYCFLKETSETGNCENAVKAYNIQKSVLTIKYIDIAVLIVGIIIVAVISL